MKIYADVVFIINLIMDIFILWLTNLVIKKKAKFFKIALGGFLMALLYCFIMFIVPFESYLNIFVSNIILIVGVVVSFRPKGLKELFKITGLCYICSFVVGGIGMALFFYTNISNIIGNIKGFYVNNFSFKILIFSACSTYILIKLFLKYQNKITIKKQKILIVKIYLGSDTSTINALVDTGNSLCDPTTKTPIVITEFNSIKQFLSDEIKIAFYENLENSMSFLDENLQNYEVYKRIRMIPFSSLGKKNGMLIGIRVDKIDFEIDGNIKTVKDIVVGIYNDKLSKDNKYQGLVNPRSIS